jgi:glycosyltransferase involved in cell wall biosynthesis
MRAGLDAGSDVRVVLGTNHLGFGGAEAAAVAVANELASRSHDVTLWVLHDEPGKMQRLDDLDAAVSVRQFSCTGFRSTAALRELHRAVKQDRPDAAVYVSNATAAGVHALVTRAPVYYWVQNHARSTYGRVLELAARVAGARIVALNRSVAATVIGGCRTVIPNPMPSPDGEHVEAVRSPAWRDGRLLIVGRIVPQKDHDFLLHVMSLLRPRPVPLELDVVGGPESPYFDRIRALAHQRGVASVVHFHGNVSAKPWFERGPMFVMTSQWEGQGVVFMEAASHGCPIIARDAPGVRDTLGLAYEGLTPHDSPSAMAAKIDAWMDEPEATATRARLLQDRMHHQYSSVHVIDLWERSFDATRGSRVVQFIDGRKGRSPRGARF